MILGERIKKLRKERGLTLSELAGSEITKGMLSLIENNKSNPSMETLKYLAKELGVSVSYLTQQGDTEWTKAMVEREEFNNSFEFPYKVIEEEVLPNINKISGSQDGMTLYHVIRVYYRYMGNADKADEISQIIEKFYKSIGLENMAIKDKINNAISMMYERDYKNAYETVKNLESAVEKYKEYDSNIYLDYLFWRSSFAIDYDIEDFIKYGKLHLEQSYKIENYKYYYQQNIFLRLFYYNNGDYEEAEIYQENLSKFLAFSQSEHYRFETIGNQPIPVHFILSENIGSAEAYDKYLEDIKQLDKNDQSSNELNLEFIKLYVPIFKIEKAYFENDFDYVINHFKYSMYDRPQAQHPFDRILFAIRASVYPLSIYKVGRVDEAKEAYMKIEGTVDDIKQSIFAKELHMIKNIIFE